MTKFSQIPTNNSPVLADTLIGVTSGGVDDRITISQLVALVAANMPAGSLSDAVWRNLCAMRGYAPAGSNVSVTAANFAKINVITTIEYDLGANYNTTTQRFVAPYTGVYRFLGTIGAANNDTRMFGSIYKNGVEYQRGENGAWTGSANRAQVAAETRLVAGDYIELWGWRAATGTLNAENFDGLSFSFSLVTRST